MSRTIILWRMYEGSDMAASDSFFPTKGEAIDSAEYIYGIDAEALRKTGRAETDAYTITLEQVKVEMTIKGIARALTELPHR